MKDSRLFIKVHNGFPEHPKTVGLSDKAFRTVVEFWAYCHRNGTDGKVPLALFKRLSPKVRKELLTDYAILHETHLEMRDYLEHQQSAQEVKELTEARQAAGRLGGKAKANRLANAKQKPDEPLPDIDIDVEKETNTRPNYADEFIDFYMEYPRKEARVKAEQAYLKARKTVDAATILAGLERYKKACEGKERQYIALPASWLNAGRWDDDYGTIEPVKAAVWSPPDWDAIAARDEEERKLAESGRGGHF